VFARRTVMTTRLATKSAKNLCTGAAKLRTCGENLCMGGVAGVARLELRSWEMLT
jgi:hypothetical protein